MNGLLLETQFEIGQIVEITHGLLTGLCGVLMRVDEDGRALIRLDECKGVYLFVPTSNITAIQSQP